jgi:hypothetical protein
MKPSTMKYEELKYSFAQNIDSFGIVALYYDSISLPFDLVKKREILPLLAPNTGRTECSVPTLQT